MIDVPVFSPHHRMRDYPFLHRMLSLDERLRYTGMVQEQEILRALEKILLRNDLLPAPVFAEYAPTPEDSPDVLLFNQVYAVLQGAFAKAPWASVDARDLSLRRGEIIFHDAGVETRVPIPFISPLLTKKLAHNRLPHYLRIEDRLEQLEHEFNDLLADKPLLNERLADLRRSFVARAPELEPYLLGEMLEYPDQRSSAAELCGTLVETVKDSHFSPQYHDSARLSLDNMALLRFIFASGNLIDPNAVLLRYFHEGDPGYGDYVHLLPQSSSNLRDDLSLVRSRLRLTPNAAPAGPKSFAEHAVDQWALSCFRRLGAPEAYAELFESIGVPNERLRKRWYHDGRILKDALVSLKERVEAHAETARRLVSPYGCSDADEQRAGGESSAQIAFKKLLRRLDAPFPRLSAITLLFRSIENIVAQEPLFDFDRQYAPQQVIDLGQRDAAFFGRYGALLRSTISLDMPLDALITLASIDVPGYRVLKPLGRGGSASVYLIQNELPGYDDGPRYALKLVEKDQGFGDLTRNEFARLSKLAKLPGAEYDPHVMRLLQVISVKRDGDKSLEGLVLEYFDGKPLNETADRPPHLVENLISGLAWLHEQGIVHLDFSPKNILVNKKASKITDFGLAGVADLAKTSHGNRLYAAPELLAASSGALDFAGDVYSLAVVVDELRNGKYPLSPEFLGIDVAEGSEEHKAAVAKLKIGWYNGERLDLLKKYRRHIKKTGGEHASWMLEAVEPRPEERMKYLRSAQDIEAVLENGRRDARRLESVLRFWGRTQMAVLAAGFATYLVLDPLSQLNGGPWRLLNELQRKCVGAPLAVLFRDSPPRLQPHIHTPAELETRIEAAMKVALDPDAIDRWSAPIPIVRRDYPVDAARDFTAHYRDIEGALHQRGDPRIDLLSAWSKLYMERSTERIGDFLHNYQVHVQMRKFNDEFMHSLVPPFIHSRISLFDGRRENFTMGALQIHISTDLALMRERPDWAEIALQAHEGLRYAPNDNDMLLKRAVAYSHLGAYANAIHDFERVLQRTNEPALVRAVESRLRITRERYEANHNPEPYISPGLENMVDRFRRFGLDSIYSGFNVPAELRFPILIPVQPPAVAVSGSSADPRTIILKEPDAVEMRRWERALHAYYDCRWDEFRKLRIDGEPPIPYMLPGRLQMVIHGLRNDRYVRSVPELEIILPMQTYKVNCADVARNIMWPKKLPGERP